MTSVFVLSAREAGVAVKRALEQLNENMTLQIDAPNREIDDEGNVFLCV